MKDIAGRHKLSDNLGAGRYWADENGVPMPDRSLSWLRFLSTVGGGLGLDHIYLRSPVTGFLKLITFGGFGLWWLWDTLQVFLEKERVIKYGLTAPFDIPMKILTGVGQGMITDQPSGYKSKASFPFFILSTLLGFTGLDSLVAGKFGLAIRRLIDFFIFYRLASSAKGGSNAAYFFAAIAGFFVVVPYFTNLWGMMTGYQNDVTYNGLLDWYMQVYDGVGTKVSDSPDAPSKVSAKIQELFGYTTVNRDTIRKQFAVVDPYVDNTTGENAKKEAKSTSNNAFKAFFWGSPIGVLIYAIVSFVGYFIPIVGMVMDGVIEQSVLDMSIAQIAAEKAAEAIADVAGAAKQTVAAATEQAKSVVAPALNAAKETVATVTEQAKAVQQVARNTASVVKSQVADVHQAVGNTASALKQSIPVPNLTQTVSSVLKPVVNLPNANANNPIAPVQSMPNLSKYMSSLPNANEPSNPIQTGGGNEPLSYEAKILGATVGALIIGGGIKGVIDHLMTA